MLESIIPATIVIDKPEIGVTSTKSSISCIEYDRDEPYKDSDCGGYPDNRDEYGYDDEADYGDHDYYYVVDV